MENRTDHHFDVLPQDLVKQHHEGLLADVAAVRLVHDRINIDYIDPMDHLAPKEKLSLKTDVAEMLKQRLKIAHLPDNMRRRATNAYETQKITFLHRCDQMGISQHESANIVNIIEAVRFAQKENGADRSR